MRRIHSACLEPDPSDRSGAADVLLRQQPNEEDEEDEEEDDDRDKDDDDGDNDEGYSE